MTGRTRARLAWIVPILVILVPPLILYWPFTFGGKALFWGTPLLQFWPWRLFAAEQLHAGRLALWNPYAGSGVPLLANHQSAVFYPLNVLFWVMPVERAMGVSLLVHAIVAGLAMYAFVRDLRCSRLAALVAALTFMLSGYMVARGAFLTEVSTLPWLPLLWLYSRRLFQPDQPRRLRALITLALVVALQFLAGHAQTWFYSLCSLALYGLWEAARHASRGKRTEKADRASGTKKAQSNSEKSRARGRSIMGRYLLLGVGVVWGVALAAIQFLPTLELSQVARRSADEGWTRFALQYSMWPWRLITLLLPDFFGNPARGDYWGYATYWEDAGYVGVLPFFLALLATVAGLGWLWARRARWAGQERPVPPRPDVLQVVPFFALLALLALLMALGSNTPIYLLFYRHVPGFASFQGPARWLGVYTAAVAVLAGAGIDTLRPSRALAVACRLGVVAMAQVAVITLLVQRFLPGVKMTFAQALLEFSLLGVLALLLLLWGQDKVQGTLSPGLGRKEQTKRIAWAAALLAVIAADLIYAGHDLNPAIDARLYAPQTEIGAALEADGLQGRTFYWADAADQVLFGRYLDFADYGSDPARLAYWWGMREALLPDLGMVEHLPSANTYEPLVQARYRTLLQALESSPPQIAQRTLGLMNVAYLLDPDQDESMDVVHRSPSVTAYRNPSLRPRAYVAHQAHLAGSPEHALSLLLSPTFDPTTVIIESNSHPSPQLPNSPIANPQPPTLLPSPPNQAKIQVTCAQPGYLVLMDTAYPGWRVYVDGRRAELLRANYAFRAVALETGDHRVVFQYQPTSLIAGTILSGVALLAIAVIGAIQSPAGCRMRKGKEPI